MGSTGNASSGALDAQAVGALTDLLGNDHDALVELVDAFIEEAPDRLAELRRGMGADDLVLVSRAAHTLKANARTFGASRLASLCQEIEAAAREGDLDPARARSDELDEAWSEVNHALVVLREAPPDGS